MSTFGKLHIEKTSDGVAARLVEWLLDGTLRGGERIDRDAVAAELGVSRAPVQEALVQLERDGIVRIVTYRGAFVERFDADVVREHFAVYGRLSGMSSARVAGAGDGRVLSALTDAAARLAATDDPDEVEKLSREFRRIVNHGGAGPRLRALFRSSASFLPPSWRLVLPEAVADLKRSHREEMDAIRAGNGERARAVAESTLADQGEALVRELRSRGVLPREDPET